MTKHLCWKTYLQNYFSSSVLQLNLCVHGNVRVYITTIHGNYHILPGTTIWGPQQNLVAAQNPWREQGAHSCPLTSWPSTKGSTVTLFHTRCLHAQPCPLSFTRWTRSPGTMFICLFNSRFQPSAVWNILLQCENSPVSSAQGRPSDPCPAPAANASLGPCYTWWKSSLGCQSSC